MKLLLITLISFYSIASMAASLTGRYEATTQFSDLTITGADCLAEKGQWIGEDEICVREGTDVAEIKKVGKNYRLHVFTLGNNASTCEFEAIATLLNDSSLSSKIKVEHYNPESGQTEKSFCVLKAKLNKQGDLDITTNLKCQTFCGASAWLEVQGLKKVNP